MRHLRTLTRTPERCFVDWCVVVARRNPRSPYLIVVMVGVYLSQNGRLSFIGVGSWAQQDETRQEIVVLDAFVGRLRRGEGSECGTTDCKLWLSWLV